MTMESDEKRNDEAAGTPTGAPPGSPAGALSALLADPALLQRLRAVIGGAGVPAGSAPPDLPEEATAAPDAPADDAAQEDDLPGRAAPAGADGLAAVLADPALLAKLPQAMALLGPLLGGAEGRRNPAPPPPRTQEEARDGLLLALRPFLSPERREALDTLLRIARLGSVLRQIR